MSVELRDMTADTIGTCDWGYCHGETVAERYSAEMSTWLAVCESHTGRRTRRPSPGRGPCSGCGKEYTLSVEGRIRAHHKGWDRCSGSGREPQGSPGGDR